MKRPPAKDGPVIGWIAAKRQSREIIAPYDCAICANVSSPASRRLAASLR
jgi:hypothetical protein